MARIELTEETKAVFAAIQTYAMYRRLAGIHPQEVVHKLGKNVSHNLQIHGENALPIVIPAYNEASALPYALWGISRSTVPVRVIVVDNGSDDNSAQIARDMGATVISEPKPGQINAMTAGFRHLRTTALSRKTLITDADCFPVPQWAASMNEYMRKGATFGTIVTGPRYFFGNGPKGVFRVVATTGIDLYWYLKYKVIKPHGPNLGIHFGQGKILEALCEMDENCVTGTDALTHDTVMNHGGSEQFAFSLRSLVFTSDDRSANLKLLVRKVLNPAKIFDAYPERYERTPGGYNYSLQATGRRPQHFDNPVKEK